MSFDPQRSTLFRLVAAGQLARLALFAPLQARGLEAGDDALLFALADPGGATRDDLLDFTGMPEPLLEDRLRVLETRGLLLRLAVGSEMLPGARLSQQGHLLRDTLAAHWQALEDDVRSELGKADRKALRHGLKRTTALLAGEAAAADDEADR